jgi:hypothetical protein
MTHDYMVTKRSVGRITVKKGREGKRILKRGGRYAEMSRVILSTRFSSLESN